MVNEKSNVDETNLDNEINNEKKETASKPVSEEANPQEKSGDNTPKGLGGKLASAGVGAGAGFLGAMALMGFVKPVDTVEPETSEPISGTGTPVQQPSSLPEPEHFDGSKVPVAYSVNDEMTFSDAFAAARQEVGAGGIFAWHGNIYSTYNANEWQGFSEEYRNAFSSYHYNIDSQAILVTDSGEDIIAIPDGHDGALNPEIVEVSAVSAIVEGQEMTFIDLDRDGTYDVMVINDEDGKPNYFAFEGEGVTIEQIQLIQDISNNPEFSDSSVVASDEMPGFDTVDELADFDNDADIGNFVNS